MLSEHKKQIFVLMLLSILLVPTLSAQLFFQQSQEVDIKIVCINAGYCSATSVCNVSVFDPDDIIILDGIQTTRASNLAFHNFTLNKSQTGKLGEYRVGGFCKDGSVTQSIDFVFDITVTGKEFTTSKAILYLGLFVIVIFVFIINFVGIGFLPDSNTKDEEGRLIQISYLKYLRSALWFVEWWFLIAIFYLSSNMALAYLETELFGKFLFTLFQITFGLTPLIVIVWVLWFFSKFFEDKEFKKLLSRGMFPQGNL